MLSEIVSKFHLNDLSRRNLNYRDFSKNGDASGKSELFRGSATERYLESLPRKLEDISEMNYSDEYASHKTWIMTVFDTFSPIRSHHIHFHFLCFDLEFITVVAVRFYDGAFQINSTVSLTTQVNFEAEVNRLILPES